MLPQTYSGGSVGTLPTPGSMFVLHHRVDVILRTCPFTPCSVRKKQNILNKTSKPTLTSNMQTTNFHPYPKLVSDPPNLGFCDTLLKGQSL